MSIVTNIILHFSIIEENSNTIDIINALLRKNNHGELGDGELSNKGGKHLESPIYIGAFNYLDVSALLDLISAIKWTEPENVQLFIQGQSDSKFMVFEPST